MHSALLAIQLVATPVAWEKLTIDFKQPDKQICFVGVRKEEGNRAAIPYFANGTDLWKMEQRGERREAKAISIGGVKGACTAGAIINNSALLLFQEFKHEFPLAATAVYIAVVDLDNGRTRTSNLGHIFGPITKPGGGVAHVVGSMKASSDGKLLAFLWIGVRRTVHEWEQNIAVVSLKKALVNFDAAWEDRHIMWRTPFPLSRPTEQMAEGFAWDSKFYLLFRKSGKATLVAPYDFSEAAKEKQLSTELGGISLIELEGKARIAAFSQDGRQLLITEPDGKQVLAFDTPRAEGRVSFLGCSSGIIAIRDQKSIFLHRLDK
jgi:hypothetical protein